MKPTTQRLAVIFSVIACAVLGLAVSASAQPFRTFVSGSGSDSNPSCSVSAPCRSLAQALSVVAAGGEIVVLDSAGYGASLTINKAISISVPDGLHAALSAPVSTIAITIAAGSSDIVRIDGLDVIGGGSGSGVGVSIGTCKRTELRRMRISRIQDGVDVVADVHVVLLDMIITDTLNGIASFGSGTAAAAGGVGPPLKVYVSNTIVSGSAGYGLDVQFGCFVTGLNVQVGFSGSSAVYINAGVAHNASVNPAVMFMNNGDIIDNRNQSNVGYGDCSAN
jgi:hypothetical protein